MRDSVRKFVEIVSEALPFPEPIYEFGSFQVEGQEGFADLRPLFPGKKYFGCDMRHGKGVDLILDLHNIDLPDETVGTVLVIDTLEHVEFCRKAISEVYRILKPDGIVVVTSVMNFPIHDYPNDYWRFTPEGFKSLLNPFSYSIVDFLGEKDFPHTVVGLGIKKMTISESLEKILIEKINTWKYLQSQIKKPNYIKRFMKQFIPPFLVELYRKLARL